MAPPSRKQEVIAALPATGPQIIKRTGVCQDSVNRWLRIMHGKGEIHVISWHWGGGNKMPKYTYGPGKDAPCKLKSGNGASYSRAYRKRKRIAEAEFVAAKQRACAHADSVVSSRKAANWLSALL